MALHCFPALQLLEKRGISFADIPIVRLAGFRGATEN